MNDQRNMPKKDAKGKLIKVKKGTPPAKSLYLAEYKDYQEKLTIWFDTKLRPYTTHLFKLISQALNQKENYEKLDELDKNI